MAVVWCDSGEKVVQAVLGPYWGDNEPAVRDCQLNRCALVQVCFLYQGVRDAKCEAVAPPADPGLHASPQARIYNEYTVRPGSLEPRDASGDGQALGVPSLVGIVDWLFSVRVQEVRWVRIPRVV